MTYSQFNRQNRRDIIKNTALSQMRLHEALKLQEKLKSQIATPLELSSDEKKEIRQVTIDSLLKYLNTFYRDEDTNYSVFHDYFHGMHSNS